MPDPLQVEQLQYALRQARISIQERMEAIDEADIRETIRNASRKEKLKTIFGVLITAFVLIAATMFVASGDARTPRDEAVLFSMFGVIAIAVVITILVVAWAINNFFTRIEELTKTIDAYRRRNMQDVTGALTCVSNIIELRLNAGTNNESLEQEENTSSVFSTVVGRE